MCMRKEKSSADCSDFPDAEREIGVNWRIAALRSQGHDRRIGQGVGGAHPTGYRRSRGNLRPKGGDWESQVPQEVG
jgi:hypothetical protein